MNLCSTKRYMSWFFQILAAGILFQTLFFKFTGAPESKFIFAALGAEPWGRIAAGIVELIAGVMLLIPGTAVYGAALAGATMLAAIGTHLTKLGLIVQDDGGILFILAVTVLVSSGLILGFRRDEIPILGRHFPATCSLH
jgi:hypothetical protein